MPWVDPRGSRETCFTGTSSLGIAAFVAAEELVEIRRQRRSGKAPSVDAKIEVCGLRGLDPVRAQTMSWAELALYRRKRGRSAGMGPRIVDCIVRARVEGGG